MREIGVRRIAAWRMRTLGDDVRAATAGGGRWWSLLLSAGPADRRCTIDFPVRFSAAAPRTDRVCSRQGVPGTLMWEAGS
ncbi:MAG: hypothetical protein CMJ31_14625 [Phycisphaerae bacterium]|nr:hypothetical protein [Phycisphaerae bacterium]